MTHDPTHLGALQTGYEEGHNDAVIALRRAVENIRDSNLRGALLRAVEGDYSNPFEKLFDNRREYVRERVTEQFGHIVDSDETDLFDMTYVVDAILDAHADWLAGHAPAAPPQPHPEPLRNTVAAAIGGDEFVPLSTRYVIADRVLDALSARRRDLPQPADCLPGDVYLVRTIDAGNELVAASRLPGHPGDSIPWRALHTAHAWHGDHEITIIAELYRHEVVITEAAGA